MGIKPLLDRVVIEPMQAEEKTAGGLYIPDNGKEKPNQGKVIAVGPGPKTEAGNHTGVDVEVGQTVLYNKYGTTEVKLEGQDYLVVNESSILGIIE